MTMKRLLHACGLLALALPLTTLADGEAIANEQCAGCHALAPTELPVGIAERGARKGPPLHYAGNKFRAEWLAGWLQQPTPLRPAGYFPPAHVVSGAEGDTVDADSLEPHPALAADAAQQVADYLMTLHSQDALIAGESYQPGAISPRMGMMDFRKFKGCNACHQDAPGEGGLSGPEVYTAWQRLQPAFIASYIKDATAWDAHTLMPVQKMNENAAHKLANYLKAIGEE